MILRFRTALSDVSLDLDVDPNKQFIDIIENIVTSDKSKVRQLGLEYQPIISLIVNPHIQPCIFKKGDMKTNIFDYFKSPKELNISDGSEVFLSRSVKARAGILPLNALYYHRKELKKYLKIQHRGLQAVFLYTSADKIMNDFMNDNLHSEIIDLSGNCIVYVPIKDLFEKNNPQFLEWWKKEYKSLDFHDALKRIFDPLYTIDINSAYDVAKSLKLSEGDMPCIVFFENHPAIHVVVKLEFLNDSFKLILALRKIFEIANKINEVPNNNRLDILRNEINKFTKQGKEHIRNFPITLVNINILSMTGTKIIDKLFGS